MNQHTRRQTHERIEVVKLLQQEAADSKPDAAMVIKQTVQIAVQDRGGCQQRTKYQPHPVSIGAWP